MASVWATIYEARVVGFTGYEVILTAKAKTLLKARPTACESGTDENGVKWSKVFVPRRHVKMETLPLGGGVSRVEVHREWVEHTDLEWS